VPRRALLTQAAELAFLASKLQEDRHNPEELQTHCTALAAVTKQLALNLEQPTVNDLGFTKRYVRCLQVGLHEGWGEGVRGLGRGWGEGWGEGVRGFGEVWGEGFWRGFPRAGSRLRGSLMSLV
jgi:hypothetical protein